MSLVLHTYAVLNILLAAFFAALIVWSRVQESSDPGSFVFWTILAVGCLVSGIGYVLKARWVVALGAAPVILLSLVIALTALVGGWIWGPRGAGTMNLLLFGGLGLAVLQLFGLGFAFITLRRARGDQPNGTHPSS